MKVKQQDTTYGSEGHQVANRWRLGVCCGGMFHYMLSLASILFPQHILVTIQCRMFD